MDIELRSGSKLGRYELLLSLGAGGMATVWIAREASDVGDRLVAVKAMLPELAQQPDFRTMFLEEGQIVRSIEHANVVRVHEVGEDRGILFMAMEWIRGDSLQTIIREARKRRPIPSEMAVRMIADTAAGLHAAHELRGWDGELRNLVHCDVSPHNILVGVDGRARLVDFGVANGTAYSDPEGGDKVKGKFGYMSPEQAEGGRVDRRSDVFSLGIVLFELTTGERLFKGETPAQTLRLVSAARVPTPQRINPEFPERLGPIVQKALARDVTQRYQTADELRQALEHYLVEQRTMVAHAAVGKLIYRVLQPRLDKQDENLRTALVAADGMLRAGLVPSANGAEVSHQNLRLSSPRLSDPPTSSQPGGSAGPFHRTPSFRPRRQPIGAILFGAFGLTCAVASIVYTTLQQQKPNALVTAPGGAPVAAAQRGQPTQPRSAPAVDTNGVSLDSIPLAERQAAASRGGVARRERVTLEEDPPSQPVKASAAVHEEKVELEETAAKPAPPQPPATAAPPPVPAPAPDPTAVELEEQEPEKPAPPPPASERMQFSVGAARSALAAATGRANACQSGEGPSGQGRAMITFSPDGPVSSVSLPAPFAGTPVGACISSAFRSARVPAFTGSAVTLPQSFRIQ
ncbi:MAG TPA: serine/threonine-protein kinase [Polyangiaceae bacterium]